MAAAKSGLDATGYEKNDGWERLHDHLSEAINRTSLALATLVAFCLVVLAGPDANLVGEGARLELPVLDVTVSYELFLYVGPLVLISLASYLQFLFAERDRIRPEGGLALPFVFNLKGVRARFATTLNVYWLVPLVIAVFTWKALPRPEALNIFFLWLASIGCAIVGQATRPATNTNGQRRLRWVNAAALGIGFILGSLYLCSQWQRPLELYGANLKERDLSKQRLHGADMRRANLQGTDLRSADLSDADLRGAHLGGANLTRANLSGARVDDETDLVAHWRDVIRFASSSKDNEQVDLSWADLSGAYLRNANLTNVTLIGVDLRRADLSGVNFGGVDLRMADLRDPSDGEGPPRMGTTGIGGTLPRLGAEDGWLPVNCLRSYGTKTCLGSPTNLPDEFPQPGGVPPNPGEGPRPSFVHASVGWDIRRSPYQASSAFELRVRGKHLCLDSTGKPGKEGQLRPVLHTCGGNQNQMWTITRVEDPWDKKKHWVKLFSHTTGACLDSDPPANAEPHFYDCDAREQKSQYWTIELPDRVAPIPAP